MRRAPYSTRPVAARLYVVIRNVHGAVAEGAVGAAEEAGTVFGRGKLDGTGTGLLDANGRADGRCAGCVGCCCAVSPELVHDQSPTKMYCLWHRTLHSPDDVCI